MLGETHAWGGIATGIIVTEAIDNLFGYSLIPSITLNIDSLPIQIGQPIQLGYVIAFGLVFFGSLLPDIDEPGSRISNFGVDVVGSTLIIWGLLIGISIWTDNPRTPYYIAIFVLFVGLVTIPKLFSWLIKRVWGHRAITHWAITCLLLSLVIEIFGQRYGVMGLGCLFMAGYGSHLLLDMMTKSGLELLMPFVRKPLWVLPKKWRLRTGGNVERKVVHPSLALFSLFYFLGMFTT